MKCQTYQDKTKFHLFSDIINASGEINEHFIGVTTVNQTDHDTLVSAIKEMFHKYDFSLEDLRGQGYDGSASMSGQYPRVQAIIGMEINKAVYIHCHVPFSTLF